MNQKEINEIKKQMTPERNCISKIAGCYVTTEKETPVVFSQTFLTLEEEEVFKYFELIKKGLSGKAGKSLVSLEFPMDEEMNGGKQDFLMKINKSKLEDDDLNKKFFNKIIEEYDYPDNYYIILLHGTYDIPGKATDGTTLDDASDYIYDFNICLLCPVKPSKAGLSYDSKKNNIHNAFRNMMVEKPMDGFIFPAFNDRMPDIHSVLYYTAKPKLINDSLIAGILGCQVPKSADEQNDTFVHAVEEAAGANLSFATAKALCVNLEEKELEEADQPVTLNRPECSTLLQNSGLSAEEINNFFASYEGANQENVPILAKNVMNENKKIKVKTGSTTITANIENADEVDVAMVNGRKCLVIEISDEITINGMKVKESLV